MSKDSDDRWMALVEDALAGGGRVTEGVDEFDRALDHIFGLLRDSALLREHRSHATSVFLSITALEETAKLSVGMYRRSTEARARSKDPLFRHRDKHHLAAKPTILRGSRLTEAIGEDAAVEILNDARCGRLVSRRESSLYIEPSTGSVGVPSEIVTASKSRQILLFSLGAFDDALVGYTSHSMEVSVAADELFARVWDAA